MTQQWGYTGGATSARTGTLFELAYPQSVAVYDTYAQAAKAVDFLADEQFPVENLAIVGTDLKTVERVLSRKTWGTVLGSAAVQGVTLGLMFSVLAWLFMPGVAYVSVLLVAIVIGVVFNLVSAAIGHALSQGKRDFTSVQQTVATRYEIVCEHKVAQQARDIVARMPGAQGF